MNTRAPTVPDPRKKKIGEATRIHHNEVMPTSSFVVHAQIGLSDSLKPPRGTV